jgi:ZIP family zinc transporter
LAVAVALLGLGYGRWQALAIATTTGLAEPLAGLVGAGLVSVARTLMPLAMGGAAGAMLFVISHEIIPETHRQGHEEAATFGLLVGFVAMTLLDTTLG